MMDMLGSGGHFKIKPNVVDYNSVYTTRYTFSKGDIDVNEICTMPTLTYFDIDGWLSAILTPPGRNAWTMKPIPKVDDMIKAQRGEFDQKKRIEIIQNLQKEMAIQMPMIPQPGNAQSFYLSPPWLSNRGANLTYAGNPAQEERVDWWYDASKKV
jgi:ABC-type transport system substrate-binding protein